MSRFARVVVPGYPHHVIQRGHRRQRVFFCDDDRKRYLRWLKIFGEKVGLAFWAYCLMDNHVHLVVVPANSDSLKRGLGTAHWKYSLFINLREGWKGYLWQSRYDSYPLDEDYCRNSIRYAELNPVRAGIVKKAEEFDWSSARAHVFKTPDVLLSESPLSREIDDWADFLASGVSDNDFRLIRKHASTGRPLGSESFIDKLEALTGRALKEKKRGRKSKKHHE